MTKLNIEESDITSHDLDGCARGAGLGRLLARIKRPIISHTGQQIVTHKFPRIGRRIEDIVEQRSPLILLTIEDVTKGKAAEIAHARLAAIVECSDDAIIAKNLDGVIETWNRGAEQLFGYTVEEAVRRPITMLMPPDEAGEESAILSRLRRRSISIITRRSVGTDS